MVFSELTPDTEETLSLFTDGTHYPSLGSVFDRIRRKYANNALYFGGAFPAGAQAPMRISFTNIPDMALTSRPEQTRLNVSGRRSVLHGQQHVGQFTPFACRDVETVEGLPEIFGKGGPFCFRDVPAGVRRLHVASGVFARAAGGFAEQIGE